MSINLVRPGIRAAVLSGALAALPTWVLRHPRADYIIRGALSAPPWVDRRALRALHERARALTRVTGVPHVVDHVLPLKHPYFCGLTVPWNLRVVPRQCNARKGNRASPDQLDFFTEPEQLAFWAAAMPPVGMTLDELYALNDDEGAEA